MKICWKRAAVARLFRLCACVAMAAVGFPMQGMAQRTFTHPGGILSQTDLERIRTHVEAGDEPWASGWKTFQADPLAQSSYTAKAASEIGGSNGQRQRASADAQAALYNAVEWHVTGKEEYARCAASILTAWGKSLETAGAELFQYPSKGMVLAAEMLRNGDGSFYSGWKEEDCQRFLDKVRDVLVPANRGFCTNRTSHPSWYTPAALTVLAAGVLLDDEELYDEGYALMLSTDNWNCMYGGSIEPDGQVREMGRDNVHAALTFADITQACQVAWNQGDDLFGEGDNRLLRGMEYWCRYNTGHLDTPYRPLDCSGLDHATGYSFYYISVHPNGFRLRPDGCSFEAVYHHYKDVKGMDAAKEFPYLTLATRLAAPDNVNHGTLLYTVQADPAMSMTEKPARPVNLEAHNSFRAICLKWQHPEKEDSRGFNLYRSTDGVHFSQLASYDFSTQNEYWDMDVTCGQPYYYKVELVNLAGKSELSEVATGVAHAGTDELPLPWNYCGIGNKASGRALYANVQDSAFAVEGLGADIGGKTDAHGFVYSKVSGDATLTARLFSTEQSYYKVGLVMRASLEGQSARVALTLGETGCRMCRMAIRRKSTAETEWVNGTNYGRAPMWMRICREGNTFSTYVSRDSIEWHCVGSTEVSMSRNYYVGMAACTGKNTGETYRAVFDHVSLQGHPLQPTGAPGKPTGLEARWTGNMETTLSWNYQENADSFVVYRSSDGVHFDSLAMVRSPRHVDVVPFEGTYCYQVAARNAQGQSAATQPVQAEVYRVEAITGKVIGTTGSYGNNSSHTREAALDGNVDTFFDAAQADGAWVGYELEAGSKARLALVKFAPRKGYASRMKGGCFQVAGQADFSDARTVATITTSPAEGELSQLAVEAETDARYLRYVSPDGGYGNVAEVQFYGTVLSDTAIHMPNLPGGNGDTPALYDLCGRSLSRSGSHACGICITGQGEKFIR
ncbi:MAG: alginate lyase family protein [Alloprevotella sp.]